MTKELKEMAENLEEINKQADKCFNIKPLVLSLDLEERPVILSAKDGSYRKVILRELIGMNRQKYEDAITKGVKFNTATKEATMTEGSGEDNVLLLSMTLFEENGNPISINEIRKFPSKTFRALVDASKELSGLDKESIEKAKKD